MRWKSKFDSYVTSQSLFCPLQNCPFRGYIGSRLGRSEGCEDCRSFVNGKSTRQKAPEAPDGLLNRCVRLYCGCNTSSTTTLPPLSVVTTLCMGAYPVSVMSMT